MSKAVNLYESQEHILTPPDIGPIVVFGSRKVDLREVDQETLDRMLRSPLTENFLNRDKRSAAKAAASPKQSAPAASDDDAKEDGAGKKKR